MNENVSVAETATKSRRESTTNFLETTSAPTPLERWAEAPRKRTLESSWAGPPTGDDLSLLSSEERNFPPSLATIELQERLQSLRRKRLSLEAHVRASRTPGSSVSIRQQLFQVISSTAHPLGEAIPTTATQEIDIDPAIVAAASVWRFSEDPTRRAPREETAVASDQPRLDDDDNNLEGPMNDPRQLDEATTLRLRTLGQVRQLAAAYRLTGISLVPCPEQVLAIRFDIQVRGRHVACYHIFWELVVMTTTTTTRATRKKPRGAALRPLDSPGDGEALHLRFVQHSLPASIPLNDILKDTVGGSTIEIGPIEHDSIRNSAAMIQKLSLSSRLIHRACTCFEIRRDALTWLQSLMADPGDQLGSYIVRNVQSNLGHTHISFSVGMASEVTVLQITLGYEDPMRLQPTRVVVKNHSTDQVATAGLGRARRRGGPAPAISDDDEEDDPLPPDDLAWHRRGDDELMENATTSFRKLPIRQALAEVTRAMAEW